MNDDEDPIEFDTGTFEEIRDNLAIRLFVERVDVMKATRLPSGRDAAAVLAGRCIMTANVFIRELYKLPVLMSCFEDDPE